MKKIIVISISGLVILALAYLAFTGLFSSIKITEKQIGPYFMVIQDHIGDYTDAPKVIGRIDSLLKLEGIKTEKSFGIYRDNPKTAKTNKTRCQFGVILESKDNERVAELQKKGFIIFEMGLTNSIVAEIPLRNKHSYIIGGMKVYPAFENYSKNNNYKKEPVIEIYGKDKIIYAMEIKK